jgi:hypothetical protein
MQWLDSKIEPQKARDAKDQGENNNEIQESKSPVRNSTE